MNATTKTRGSPFTGSMRTALLTLLLVAVLPSLVMQGGIYYFWLRTSQRHEMQADKELARSLAGTFDAYVHELANEQTTLGAAIVAKWPMEPKEMTSLLVAAAQDRPALDAFVFLDLNGKIVAASDARLIGVVAKDREYFQRAMRTRHFYLSDLLEGRADANPFFIVARGVYDGDRLLGVIGASLRPDRLGDATLKVPRFGGGGVSYYDRLGQLVYRYPSAPLTWEQRRNQESGGLLELALAGQEAEGTLRLAGEDEDRIGARVPISDLGWVAGASKPRSTVVRALFQSLLWIAVVNVAVIGLSLAGAWVISHGIVNGLHQLRLHALAVGEGRLDRTDPSGRITEVRDLAEAFNEMVAARQVAEYQVRLLAKFPEEDPSPVLRVGQDMMLGYANEAAGPMLKSWFCQDNQPVPPAIQGIVRQALRTGETFETEVTNPQKRTFLVAFVPVAEAGYVNVYGRDITTRKQAEEAVLESRKLAEEAEAKYRSLVEESLVGVYLIQDGRFVYVNPRMAEMFGFAPEEVAGVKTVTDLVAPEDRPLVEEKLRQRLTGEVKSTHYSFRALRKDGRALDVEVIGSRTTYNGRPAVIGTLLDVTERKRIDEELRRTAAELARSNQDLEQFAYVASHDLQEPLRMVSGHLEIIQRNLGGDRLDPATAESLGYAVDGALRMQALILDLLAYSRVGTQAAALEPTDARAAAERAAENLQARIDESGAVVAIDPLPTVRAARVQLTQLFQNLIGNAIKYRRKDVRPEVHVSAVREGPQWHFQVRDNGIGIAPRDFERIFMVFQRLHTGKEYPGTGIGLAICKKIVERHGGRIWVESRPGEGTTFHFSIPAGPEDREGVKPGLAQAATP